MPQPGDRGGRTYPWLGWGEGMADPRRSINDDIETTIASLDALYGVDRARRAGMLEQLKAVVADLDAPSLPDEPEPTIERPVRDEPRRSRHGRDLTEEEAEALLPTRKTSRGGQMGPAVRAKLVRIALQRGGW